ncbi:MAG: polyribonucleotide nucleotidyltransferase, polyribonucleotide nucleotidyltransferase [Candidatus Peregrinibacteria bacterium GW2011_GWE2_39_6]|nr:MAG: polyribonucleotide nucleotidyltransferase, polyribonucleotide nucleotidyltransferase [Candidatus Peregrinibacteria bacterium GW2011_GWF2_39_17]KKR23462.1 MAG: polyribonucleotide nucleotidyltransferase, polyribonucleotide nucleotidyltransferase [Candidatus Peregrinibacteria bacterium GW2011_GWE2_39_6]HCW31920.1 polyribonucleotide nucleotidyltransferase [Candidatus Peregrinibacteria bacterium]
MATVQSVSCELAGKSLVIETGRLAHQANGAVTIRLGDTMVLATAGMNLNSKDEVDYFPLMVDYEEKYYAAGKIKGSRFIKREGRPSDNAILISRMIDRPIRPLFPKGMTNDVQLIISALSADLVIPPDSIGITAASAALMVSGIPFGGPVAGVRIGYIALEEGGVEQLVVNPTYEQIKNGRLNLIVAGTADAITMVEAACNEVTENIILQALELAHQNIKILCELQKELAQKVGAVALEAKFMKHDEEAEKAVDAFITREMLDAIKGNGKKIIKAKIHELEERLFQHLAAPLEEGVFSKSKLGEILNDRLETTMRANILEKGERLDGRALDEIRPINIELDLLPRPHGSALFQRGETQALTITTLGAPGDAQIIDTMDEDVTKRYIHYYNFPPYSVGEVKPLRGVSRREIGHGNLAERSLDPVIPSKEEFPYTIMCVSEITTCNGSSSMASVCGSSLSLMAAGVPIKRPVAGIAMGLIVKDKADASLGYTILTDIQGMEDFAGDMDFKVAGTEEGINALQMDIKAKGLSLSIMKEALDRAKQARIFILGEMAKVLPAARQELSKYAPLITTIQINTEQIRDVIGKGGETIQKITEQCGVTIDIEQTGLVLVTAPDQASGQKAVDWIKMITYVPKVGDVFDGRVTRIMDFGCFVELVPGKEGLVHISELEHFRVNKVEDVAKIGDKMKVKLMEIDDMGRYNLSRKALLPRPEKFTN